ncbi:sulfur carrier protein ThiS [Psychrobacter lutiphocae]|uniref:sulfur carrier protein ThiS n=1 Tax=Psychrobacter lutiphocae TaxID=540500 RepID=UPI00036CCF24|nr:sulfur carrier protein ThiS [Psychrobacter lutiphocae]
MYNLKINGEQIQTEQTTVKPVLDDLNLTQGRYAVEINGDLIPKSELAAMPTQEGMVIEVVQAVGGG